MKQPRWTRIVAGNIKRLCKERGITQKELARRSQVGTRTLTNIQSEEWTGSPTLATLEQLARVLRVKPWELCMPAPAHETPGPTQVDVEALSTIIELVQTMIHRQERPLPPAASAEYVAYLYAEFQDNGEIPTERTISRLMALRRGLRESGRTSR